MHTPDTFTPQPETWWDPKGPFWTLHAINPLRTNFINQHTNANSLGLDVGCGGGILTESLAEQHTMIGIDIDKNLIAVAKSRNKPDIKYENTTSDAIVNDNLARFDFITCLEVLEHVDNPSGMVKDITAMLKPGGMAFYSTLNRNPVSFLGAIVVAEHVLNLLPKNTHLYEKFIKPTELIGWNLEHGCHLVDMTGIHYNPLNRQFFMAGSTLINYICCFRKQER